MNTKQLTKAVKALQEANKPKIGDLRIVKRGFMDYVPERLEEGYCKGNMFWCPFGVSFLTAGGAREYIVSRIGTDNAKKNSNVVAYFTK